jgi:hypothetical protein
VSGSKEDRALRHLRTRSKPEAGERKRGPNLVRCRAQPGREGQKMVGVGEVKVGSGGGEVRTLGRPENGRLQEGGRGCPRVRGTRKAEKGR